MRYLLLTFVTSCVCRFEIIANVNVNQLIYYNYETTHKRSDLSGHCGVRMSVKQEHISDHSEQLCVCVCVCVWGGLSGHKKSHTITTKNEKTPDLA